MDALAAWRIGRAGAAHISTLGALRGAAFYIYLPQTAPPSLFMYELASLAPALLLADCCVYLCG